MKRIESYRHYRASIGGKQKKSDLSLLFEIYNLIISEIVN